MAAAGLRFAATGNYLGSDARRSQVPTYRDGTRNTVYLAPCTVNPTPSAVRRTPRAAYRVPHATYQYARPYCRAVMCYSELICTTEALFKIFLNQINILSKIDHRDFGNVPLLVNFAKWNNDEE